MMLDKTKTEVYAIALNQFGIAAQTDMLIEEMAELTQALLHDRRGRSSNISEEIADVMIMIEQVVQYYGMSADVNMLKEKKLRRLAERVGMKGWLTGGN